MYICYLQEKYFKDQILSNTQSGLIQLGSFTESKHVLLQVRRKTLINHGWLSPIVLRVKFGCGLMNGQKKT
ncbi:hypothetical protein CEXT_400531 [Caerostris extrusa]|uniref:Uncharacterized protein n=1 Tax=Caerostris extrusa TaxID=172846 RepID=A0AAV4RED5_CAEEX|nr:hypothetical protein CEXT_400531 [Caerostris extrusa]